MELFAILICSSCLTIDIPRGPLGAPEGHLLQSCDEYCNEFSLDFCMFSASALDQYYAIRLIHFFNFERSKTRLRSLKDTAVYTTLQVLDVALLGFYRL